jgi:hypothetical protein
MNASSILMAVESLRGGYKVGETCGQMWPLFLSPDTELDVLYGGLVQQYKAVEHLEWNERDNVTPFFYGARPDEMLGFLLYYAETNSPTYTQKLLDLETSRMLLDKALKRVQALDKFMHTDVASKVKAKIKEIAGNYEQLNVLSIGGGRTNDSKLRLASFYMNSVQYKLDRFVKDVKECTAKEWDMIIPFDLGRTTDIFITPTLAEKIFSSDTLKETSEHNQLQIGTSIAVRFTNNIHIKQNTVTLNLANWTAVCVGKYRVTVQMSAVAHKELAAWLQAQAFPSKIQLKAKRVFNLEYQWGRINYEEIEKVMRDTLAQKEAEAHEKV